MQQRNLAYPSTSSIALGMFGDATTPVPYTFANRGIVSVIRLASLAILGK